MVGQGVQHQVVLGQALQHDGAGLDAELPQLPHGDPGDQHGDQLRGGQIGEGLAQVLRGDRAEDTGVQGTGQQLRPGLRFVEHVLQQLGQLEHLGALAAQQGGELVVLGAGPVQPQHLVEQEPLPGVGSQALHLGAGPVHDHPAQRGDLIGHPAALEGLWPLCCGPLCRGPLCCGLVAGPGSGPGARARHGSSSPHCVIYHAAR